MTGDILMRTWLVGGVGVLHVLGEVKCATVPLRQGRLDRLVEDINDVVRPHNTFAIGGYVHRTAC